MGFLLTVTVLFVFTLLVPGLASADAASAAAERAAAAALRRAQADERTAAAAASTASSLREQADASTRQKIARQEALIAERELEKVRLSINALSRPAAAIKTEMAAASAAIERANKEIEKLSKNFLNAEKFAEKLSGELGGMLSITTRLDGTLYGMFRKAQKEAGGLQQILKEVNLSMSDTFSTGNLLNSVFQKLKQSTIGVAYAQDSAIASFVRGTGAIGRYDEVITNVFNDVRRFGVEMGEASQAAQSLYSGMSAFSTVNSTVATELVRTVSLMNEFGISTDTSARAMDEMTRSLNMTAIEAAQTSVRLINMAESIGVPPARLMEELTSVAPRIAQWGDEMIDVFLELQGAAKATGVALGSLVGIASQFDTFEGAAEAAGRLNSMLGGPYLNAIEMLRASEGDRIRGLIQTIELTGRSWASMDRYTKMAIAASVNINNMSEANRIFGQSLSAYDAAQAAAMANAGAQRELHERALAAKDVFEMLKAAVNSFAVAVRPAVIVLKGFFEQLARVADFISEHPYLEKLVLATTAFVTIAGVVGSFAFAVKGLVATLGLLPAAMGLGTAAVGLFTMALKVLAFGTGLTLVVSMLGALNGIFTERHSDDMPTAIGVAADNMRSLASAAATALPSIRALNREIPITAHSVAKISAANAGRSLRAGAAGVSSVRVTESVGMRNMFGRLLASQENYSKRVEAMVSQPTQIRLSERVIGQTVRGMVNSELRIG